MKHHRNCSKCVRLMNNYRELINNLHKIKSISILKLVNYNRKCNSYKYKIKHILLGIKHY